MATLSKRTSSPESSERNSNGHGLLPRCRTCKKILNNTLDRQRTRDQWWTNCKNCRTTHTTNRRAKRDAGLIKDRHRRQSRSAPTQESSNTETVSAGYGSKINDKELFASYTDAFVRKSMNSFGTGEPWRKKDPEKIACGECGEYPEYPWLTSCGHIICGWGCYDNVMNAAAEAGLANGTCKACGQTFFTCAPLEGEHVFKSAPKKRKRGKEHVSRKVLKLPQLTECSVCGELVSGDGLAELSACTHQPDVCKECFLGWLGSQLDCTTWDKMQCPSSGCGQSITHADVHTYASDEIYSRFDELSIRALLSADPNFRYCLAEGCSSGQIHDTGIEGNIFRCNACNFRVCIIHDVPFHTGETCSQYDERQRREEKERRRQDLKREHDDEASRTEVERSTTKCPGCEVPIHKYEACDHITCTRCRFEFCYICRAPYQGRNGIWRAGNKVHTTECKYHPENLPDYQDADAEDTS